MSLIQELSLLARGQSFWKVWLSTGRMLSELETVTDIRSARTRHAEWLEDIIGSGDLAKVVEIVLCTPRGEVHREVSRPYSVFQLNCGTVSLLDQQKRKTAQIIGVIDGEEGACLCAIWDAREQCLYPAFRTTILHFDAWRPGMTPLGRLNVEALGVRL